MNFNDYNNLATSAAPEMQKLYATLPAYFRHVREDLVEKSHLRPHLEPRRISAPAGYHPFSCVPAALYAILFEAGAKQMSNTPIAGTEITAVAVAYQLVWNQVPVYYVAPEFAEAVAQTELPPDYYLKDLHWPMPGMVIGWPTEFMRRVTGADTCYVFCGKFPKGDVIPPALVPLPTIVMPHEKVAFQHYNWENGNLASYVSAYFTHDRADKAIDAYDYVDYTGRNDEAKNKVDETRTNIVSGLMLKLLLVLNLMPHLIQKGVITRKAKAKKGKKHKGEVRPEIWSANVIGASYRATVAGGNGSGSHASPRMHWRRGHIAFVARRKKGDDFLSVNDLPRLPNGMPDWDKVTLEQREVFWACHERKWIQPVLVNP